MKLDKALYELKQAPRAWYEGLLKFLLKKGFKWGKVHNTIFPKFREKSLLSLEVYVDDIIIGASSDSLCDKFVKLMISEFKISMIGELSFFLRW